MHVADFNASMPSAESVKGRLESEERHYRFDQLREVFDFDELCSRLKWLGRVWREHLSELYSSEYQGLLKRIDKAEEASKTAAAFRNQISRIEAAMMPDDNFLNERLAKAAEYFKPLTADLRDWCLKLSELEIDNKEVRKKVKEACDESMICLDIKYRSLELILSCGFRSENYNRIKTDCLLEYRTKTRKRRLKKIERTDEEPGTVNEALRERLQEWRMERFKADNVPAYTIMHQSTLMDIASFVPKTKEELLAIKGFGEAKYKKYGDDILRITAEF